MKDLKPARIYTVAFSGGLDSFVTTHLLLNREQAKDTLFVLVNFDIASEQNQVQQYCATQLYDYLKKQFDKHNIVFSRPKIDFAIEQLTKQDLKAGNEKLPFYVGSRNAVFATMLMSIGEAIANALGLEKQDTAIIPVLGIHKHITYEQYWDTTPAFAAVIKQLAGLNSMYRVQPTFPIINWTKRQIVEYVWRHRLPYQLTWTCYNPVVDRKDDKVIYRPCKQCQACIERYEAAKDIINQINDYEIIVPVTSTNKENADEQKERKTTRAQRTRRSKRKEREAEGKETSHTSGSNNADQIVFDLQTESKQ